MKLKKINLKKLAAICTAITLQTSGMVANLNSGFAEEDAPQVIYEVVESSIDSDMTITIDDKIIVENENTGTTTTNQEASETYSTREETEQAVEETTSQLEDEEYTSTETSNTEEIPGSHTEEEKIIETEDNFSTESEAESELEDEENKIDEVNVNETEDNFSTESESESELENEENKIDEVNVNETEEQQVETSHNKSTETSDITYVSEEDARAAAENRINEIRSGLNDGQTLDYSITVTTEQRKTGEECVDIARKGKTFWYDKDTGKYINSEGMTFEEYIETTRGSFEQSGIVNINVSTHFGEDTKTEIDSTAKSEYLEFNDEDAAQTELERILSTYTKENGYANLNVNRHHDTVKIGEHSESDTFTYTYGTLEEAQEAVSGVVNDLLNQGYDVTDEDVKITERIEATDDYEESSTAHYFTREEAEAAMEEAITRLSEDYGNVEGTVQEFEGVHHYEAVDRPDRDFMSTDFQSADEARAAAREYIKSISLEEGHILNYSIKVYTIQYPHTYTVTAAPKYDDFTLNENGVYVNEDGVDLDTYIASAKEAMGEEGYVNIEVEKRYSDGSHTEVGEAIHEEGTFDTEEAAINALAELKLKYTEANGYTNIRVGDITTRLVVDEIRTDTTSVSAENVIEQERESTKQRLIKELNEQGYAATVQGVQETSFEVIVRDDEGNVVFDENPISEYNGQVYYSDTNEEYATRAEAEARIEELKSQYQDESRIVYKEENEEYLRYDTSYTFEINTKQAWRTEGSTETYNSEEEALEIVKALREKGYGVAYLIKPETETVEVTVNKSYATREEAEQYAEEVKTSLNEVYEEIQITKRRTGNTESHKVELEVEEGFEGYTYDEAQTKLAELEEEFTDSDEKTYEIKVVRAVDDNGNPKTLSVETGSIEVSKKFKTRRAAQAYIESLKDQGYNNVSGLRIDVGCSRTETWGNQEHGEVNITPDNEETIYNYDHLDIIYGGGNGQTTMTYVDLTAKDPQTYTITGSLHVDKVIINNNGEEQILEMEASADADRKDNEYKSDRGFGEGKHYDKKLGWIYDGSLINDDTIVTIDGTLEYTNPITGVKSTVPYKLTGKLNGGTNKCKNTVAPGYDLTFSSITIINESVLIDANIDYEYKVLGEAIATQDIEAYDIEVVETDHEFEYVVTGKGTKEQETGKVVMNTLVSQLVDVYTVNVYENIKLLANKKETKYNMKVTGYKTVELNKTVYDIKLDCNLKNEVIDEDQYVFVVLSGQIDREIMQDYYGYIIRSKEMVPVMVKYYEYKITAKELKEKPNVYYDLVVKGHKNVDDYKEVYVIEFDYNEIKTIINKYVDVEVTGEVMKDIMTDYFGYIINLDIMTPIMEKHSGEKSRLTVDLSLIASTLFAGSIFDLKKKKEDEEEENEEKEEKGKVYRKKL